MQFTAEREALADGVAWAGRTVPARPPMPMLAGLRLEARASDGVVAIASFDFEVSGRVEIAADVAEDGVALVNGRLLVDIVKALPGAPVQVGIEGSRLRVRCGRTTYELPTLPVEEYPALPAMPPASGTLPGSLLATAVSQVAVAAGRDEALPFLTGVKVEVEGPRITLVATDRYRLGVRTLEWNPADPDFSAAALVPARTLADTAKALAHSEEVRLAFGGAGVGEGLLGIEGSGRRTTTRLLEGALPDLAKLLPDVALTTARVETAALVEAVKRVSLVAERTAAVKMLFSDSEVILEAGTGDDAIALDAIECRLTGNALDRVAFNPGYLAEGLAAIGHPVANLAFTVAGKAAVISGAPDFDAPASREYLYLLMPMRLPF
ncbi:MAG: DNA polymerase III subunit beta [Candidatus Nanopelagicales bacterium]